MFGADLLPLSDTHQLDFELGDLDWTGNPTQAEFSASTEPYDQAPLCCPAQASFVTHSSLEDTLDTVLPVNWGVHILTLLSKNRDQPEDRTAASGNGSDGAHQTSSGQDQSQITAHPPEQPDKVSRQKEKNKRAQRRHRDKQKAKEEETSTHIAILAAELKKMQWEKTIIEEQAETLKTALAVRTCGSAEAAAAQVHTGLNFEYWPSSGWIPQAVMKTTLHTGSPELITAEQVKAMNVADHQHLWRLLVFKLAKLIPAVQGQMDSAAGLRLKELMVEHGMRIACVAACNFDCLHQLLTSSMETGLPAGPTFADKWRIVAASAEFSDVQTRQILKIRRHYYEQAGAIANSRSRIVPWLQAQGSIQGNYPGMASQFVTSHAAMQQLQENLLQEQNLLISLLGSVWRRTCTILQTAIMSVQSYPLSVDVVAMMNCMAEDAGEPPPEDLMAGYASCKFILDSSALRVPSPDLLLEASQWTVDYPTHRA